MRLKSASANVRVDVEMSEQKDSLVRANVETSLQTSVAVPVDRSASIQTGFLVRVDGFICSREWAQVRMARE
jgi:hypothetical protein